MLQDCFKSKRFILTGVIGGVMALCIAISPAEAKRRQSANQNSGGGYNPPYADIVLDVKTGKVLHSTNPDALRHPASVTKVMTLYLLFEQLERGNLNLNTQLRVSANAAKQPPSKLGVRPGQTISVEDAIKALVTRSANDIAVAIAENIGGSESAFANMMTRKARTLGMSRTVYRNASGLPNPGQITTARDLSVLARAIQDRFPKYYTYFQTRSFEFGNQVIGNHNNLLGRIEGVDGIKTGYTRASGFNLMTNAKTADRHVVAIVLGGRTAAWRDNTMANLVENGMVRAYAGVRQTPAIAETSTSRRNVTIASADINSVQEDEVDTTSSTNISAEQNAGTKVSNVPVRRTEASQARQVRAVVASATTAGTTATPTVSTAPNLRWSANSTGNIPPNAHAYAAPAREKQSELTKMLTQENTDKKKTITTAALSQPQPSKKSGWIIQLGASDTETKANAILTTAKAKSGKTLAKVSAFTEKVNASGNIVYRARFSGFSDQNEAQNACNALKRNGFSCFASRA